MTSVFRHVRMGSLTPRLPQVFGEESKGEESMLLSDEVACL